MAVSKKYTKNSETKSKPTAKTVTKVEKASDSTVAPAKTAVKITKSPNSAKDRKQTIFFIVFVLAWTGVSMVASQYIIGLPFLAILGDNVTMPLWTCVYDALVYLLTFALVFFFPPMVAKIYRRNHPEAPKSLETDLGTNTTELGIQHLPTLVDIGLAPIGYVVYLFIAQMLTALMEIFPWFDANQPQDVGFNYFVNGFDRFIAMIALVIIAPIAEELIMRGWLYGKLRSKLKVPLAMLLVSVLFGLLHGQWNIAISTFALSIILCSLREITGTIWAGVLLHVVSNGIAFYLLYVAM